jgi:hypothetical protein
MAEQNTIFYKIEIHGEEGLATIRNMEGQFVKTKVPVENLNLEMSKLNGTMSLTTSEAGRQMAKLNRLRGNVQINSKEYQNLTKSMRMYQKQLDMSTGATGSATSAAMELGRVISDAPYGIRGVANNLSQFASQMAFSAKSTGSLRLAVKDLFTALTGPLGILLVIQAVISAIEKMSMAKKEAKEASEKLNEALKKEVETLEGFDAILKNVNSTVEDRNNAIIAASIKSKDFREALKDTNGSLSEQERAIRDVINAKKDQITLDEKLIKLNKLNEQLKDEVRSLDELNERLSVLKEERKEELKGVGAERARAIILSYQTELDYLDDTIVKLEDRKGLMKEITDLYVIPREVIEGSVEWYKKEISLAKQKRDQISEDNKVYKEQTEIIEKLKKELEAITGVDGGKTKLLEIDDFDETAKTYEKELSKLNEKTELLDAKSEAEKLEIKKKYHLARLDAQHTEHIEKYEQTAAEYKADLKLYLEQQVLLDKMSQEDANKRLAIFDSNTKTQIKQSNDSFEILRSITKKSYDNRILDALFAGQKLAGDGKTQAQKDLIDTHRHLKHKAELYASYADTVKQVLGSIGDFIGAEFERELVTEENRNNESNKILNDRLLNENLSKDQRADIQNQIAQNDEKLRVKKEKIARKQFNVEKAFKIGMALADTASSALKAYGSQIIIGDPTSIIRAAAAAKVATAFGLANVAMIARSKFQTAAPSKPANPSLGGSGETSERAEPSFNIVGRSNDNLLINAIQAQFGKPLKAYVVSRDVTTQQQLDGMIVGQAGT